MKKFGIVAIIIIVILALWLGSQYNSLVPLDENVKAKWSQVLNEYKRRADLVPNLVKTVEGFAKQERELMDQAMEARAKVGSMNVTVNDLSNPKLMEQFQQAQANLSSALSRLIAVSERYPESQASPNFLTLQAQLEGTENRISVERKRYIESVQKYNNAVRVLPMTLVNELLGFPEKVNFSVENEREISDAPAVEFN